MSRLALFILFIIWSVGSDADSGALPTHLQLTCFLGAYSLMAVALIGAGMASRDGYHPLFQRAIAGARLFTIGWFAVGVFCFHWIGQVDAWLGPAIAGPRATHPLESIPALLGTLPALLAWVSIAIARYPISRANREAAMLEALNDGLPVHPLGGLGTYLSSTLRLDLLFTIVPIGMILVLRDAAAVIVSQFTPHLSIWAEPAISLLAAGVVFLLAPMLLVRVLSTRPLPPSPLRSRLEEMCQSADLRYRQILLWQTDHHVGNAAVMGVVPSVRYILLSDLLLETMTDEQIEAVFAHELGHVVHKHLTWLGVFVVIMLLAAMGPGEWVGNLADAHTPGWVSDGLVPIASAIGGLLVLFGGLSPSFERQADVYAARTIERFHQPGDDISTPPTVGTYGANLFASALHRVAMINGIPIHARTLSHGSIAGRIEYLHALSTDPARTRRFDRKMSWLYRGVIATLLACGIWTAMTISR